MTTEEIARLRALLVADPLGTVRWTNDYPDDSDGEAWALVDDEKFPRPYGVLWCDRDNAPVAPHRELIAAAVNALPALLDAAERGLDDRLRFGPVTNGRFGPIRYAVAADGALYDLCGEPEQPDVTWHLTDDDEQFGVEDTPRKAIEAARAHDRARRGAK